MRSWAVKCGRWLLLGGMLLSSRSLLAQAAWEYSPYDVRLWVAAQPQVELPPAAIDSLSRDLAARGEAVFGSVWSVRASAAPASLRADLLAGANLTGERLKLSAPDLLAADKLIVVSLAPSDLGWEVSAREMDLRTRLWSDATRRDAANIELLPHTAWDAAAACFTPLARIERVEGPQVVARLRAGGLIVDPASRAWIEPEMVLRPIIRRNDRAGEPLPKGGIQQVPWTLLSVRQRIDSLLTCELFSGYRAAIPSRGGVRTDRLALLVRPRYPATRLVLQSRAKPPQPLTGYEVHSREPSGTETQLIGVTDWRGSLEIPAGDNALRVFLVKNGNQLLARLPIVPGQAPQLDAPLPDDDLRLQAEGAVTALYSRALDLVARREILAARIRSRLKERKFDEAQVLLDDFRQLETRIDLGRALDTIQQAGRGGDKLTQARIDKLFAEARKVLLLKPLADDMVNTLAAELAKATAAATPAATPMPAPATSAATPAPTAPR
ncbi:MAG: hypothetical protein SFU86_25460 [Pirellulaceae bacterium]|nr:hypothetical protein [Pirellulaceae bacterium]